MKKLITLLTIATILITSAFSAENRNIIIDGAVEQLNYTFDLDNIGSTVDGSEYLYDDGSNSVDLTTTTTTSEFLIQRSSGNENRDSYLYVRVHPSSFKGTVNSGKIYDTKITPTVEWQSGYNSYNYGSRYNLIAAHITHGYKAEKETVAAFKLKIVGDKSFPASSDYKSTIHVWYYFN